MRILVPVAKALHLQRAAPASTAFCQGDTEGSVDFISVVEIDEGSSLSTGALTAQALREELEVGLQRALPRPNARARCIVRVAHHAWQEIATTAVREGYDLLLLFCDGLKAAGSLPETVSRLLYTPPCNTLLLEPFDPSSVKRILLPARGGPHADLAYRIAVRLAEATKAEVSVLHVNKPGSLNFPPDLLEPPDVPSRVRVRRYVLFSLDVAEAVAAEAANYDLVIMGTSSPSLGRLGLGEIAEEVVARVQVPVVLAKTRTESWQLFSHATSAPQPNARLSHRVDKWFAENNFHAREFSNLAELVELKERAGLSISLGLPALNEEATVGTIIKVVKQALYDTYPLLDEIVLIDSGSCDRTVEIAVEMGIPAVRHQDILAQYGSFRGKGEALWKSLYVLRGDIVVWIDTDISNIDPKFVSGLVAPILKEPRIKFVKGYYRRPVLIGDRLYETGGGRVTELTVRPLFNLFFPQLSGFIQPLAGEYAGRREVLESVPFFTGYGVEAGLLIDIEDTFGLEAMGQVNLEERVHRNQSLAALSQMAFAITQVVLQRLEQRRGVRLMEHFNRSMKLIRSEDGVLSLDVKEIGDLERPPMITIPEYRQTRRVRG
jgi:nucleotide-binding universal stress UspA family protein